jgi:pimeloyl-ACP methyl ester carboxylesterase
VATSDVQISPFELQRDGFVLAGEAAGDGDPILLLHGLTATRRYVLHGSKILERAGHRTISYDARGHGASGGSHDSSDYSYGHLIADAIAVLDHFGIERLPVGGHSMGAATAAGLALEHPERVSALVLVGPAHRGAASDNQPRWDSLAEGLAEGGVDGFVAAYGVPDLPGAYPETILRVVRQRLSRHQDPQAQAAALKGITRTTAFDGLSRLEKIACPTLVVGSRDDTDPDHPLAIAQEYANRIPGAALIVEDEGESPLAWRGGSLSREIDEFLTRVVST